MIEVINSSNNKKYKLPDDITTGVNTHLAQLNAIKDTVDLYNAVAVAYSLNLASRKFLDDTIDAHNEEIEVMFNFEEVENK